MMDTDSLDTTTRDKLGTEAVDLAAARRMTWKTDLRILVNKAWHDGVQQGYSVRRNEERAGHVSRTDFDDLVRTALQEAFTVTEGRYHPTISLLLGESSFREYTAVVEYISDTVWTRLREVNPEITAEQEKVLEALTDRYRTSKEIGEAMGIQNTGPNSTSMRQLRATLMYLTDRGYASRATDAARTPKYKLADRNH